MCRYDDGCDEEDDELPLLPMKKQIKVSEFFNVECFVTPCHMGGRNKVVGKIWQFYHLSFMNWPFVVVRGCTMQGL